MLKAFQDCFEHRGAPVNFSFPVKQGDFATEGMRGHT